MKASSLILLTFLCIVSCKSNDDSMEKENPSYPTISTDAELWTLVNSTSNWTYWKNSADTLNKGNGSGHIENRLQTRYNETAAGFLDANGKVKSNAVFTEGALIVKELYINSTLNTVAVMYKNETSPHKTANNWVWGYFQPNGTVRSAISTGATNCQNCHSTGIDYTLMNGAHN